MQQSWATTRTPRVAGAHVHPVRFGKLGRMSAALRRTDALLWIASILLSGVGLAAVYAATFAALPSQGLPADYYLVRQAVQLVLALVVGALVALIDYRRFVNWIGVLFAGMVLILAAVLSPLGAAPTGAKSWFDFGVLQLEPSEFTKVGMIIVVAVILTTNPRRTMFKRMVIALAAVGMLAVEVLAQPDLGMTADYLIIGLAMLMVAGVRLRWILALIVLGSVAVFAMFHFNLVKPYQQQRLTAFLHPNSGNGLGSTYNIRQSLMAVGTGGVTGTGYLKGSLINQQYVPAASTDFIFTSIADEFGFVGAAVVLAMFALLLWRSLRIAIRANNVMGMVLAGGLATMFAFEVFVNVGMTVSLMPITGLPLPFISYGGSSLLANFIAIGLLQGVAAHRHRT